MIRVVSSFYLITFFACMSFAKSKVDNFKTADCNIQATNFHSINSIVDVLESADNVSESIDCFEICITFSNGEPVLKCVLCADILKAIYSKKKFKYSGMAKEQKYGNFLKDLIRDSKLSRVEYRKPPENDKSGKEN